MLNVKWLVTVPNLVEPEWPPLLQVNSRMDERRSWLRNWPFHNICFPFPSFFTRFFSHAVAGVCLETALDGQKEYSLRTFINSIRSSASANMWLQISSLWNWSHEQRYWWPLPLTKKALAPSDRTSQSAFFSCANAISLQLHTTDHESIVKANRLEHPYNPQAVPVVSELSVPHNCQMIYAWSEHPFHMQIPLFFRHSFPL